MERVLVIDNEFDPAMVSVDAVEGRLLDVVCTAVDEINCTGDKGVVMFSSIKVTETETEGQRDRQTDILAL